MQTICELRQERGWARYELALKVGVHPRAVYLWEGGGRTPRLPQPGKPGHLFGLCSDEIELEPPLGVHPVPHQARADRSPGDPVPGRDRRGRPATRSTDDEPGSL